MRVLVACEFSGIVREAFAKRGHDAWSCDLLPTEIPGQHIQGDVLPILNQDWDLMIAHPPCTHLAVSGARHFAKKIADGSQQQGIDLFMQFVIDNIPKWAIENPIGIMSTKWRKPDQIIQPWQFGEPFQKSTCLWLNNLPKLKPTKIVDKGEFITFPSGKKMAKWCATLRADKQRGHIRSKTFQGIADAMAEQWD
jgi:site-specific DNA-cytosine methylase